MFDIGTSRVRREMPGGIEDLDADATLDVLSRSRAMREEAECAELACAAHWADLHSSLDRPTSIALPGAERLIRIGGEGTPDVAEFAPAEFGAELGISVFAATAFMADSLDLRHRLPVLWGRIMSGEVKPSIGRRVAQETRGLGLDAVALVDDKVARWSSRLTWSRLSRVVEAAVAEADPEAAQVAVDLAESERGVWINPSERHGMGTAFIRADAPSLAWFDSSLNRIADALRVLGDDATRDERRARAVGILAHPQHALDLHDEATAVDRGADRAELRRATVRSGSTTDSRPKATLFVHVTSDSLSARPNSGVARVEGVGPVLLDQVRRWLGHCNVTMKPVIDVAGIAAVDAYEIPDRIREGVHLVSPADCFPFASSTSRHGDLDHTTPYVSPDRGGPPGQTGMGNLGPLTRFHHRIRTHGGWQVKQPFVGIFVWRSPHGRFYLVDPTGTRRITLPG